MSAAAGQRLGRLEQVDYGGGAASSRAELSNSTHGVRLSQGCSSQNMSYLTTRADRRGISWQERGFFQDICLFATPPISQAREPLARQSQSLERSPESLIPETPRLPSAVPTVGSTTTRQDDRTEEEEARAYLDVGLGSALVWSGRFG